jgi:hypothetical protein
MEPDLHRSPKRRVAPEVRDWRRHVLRQAGFEDVLARQLAADADVDLHDLLELVDAGCPPELAARILAPL